MENRDLQFMNKLKNKNDLYDYLSDHLNIWLPQKKYCRLSFLQEIIQDKKKYFEASQIKMRNIKQGWKEFSVKNVFQYIKEDKAFQQYLPWEEMQQGRHPDKHFFWGVAFTVKSAWADSFYNQSLMSRNQIQNNPFEKKTIVVSENWKQKLALHDFLSKSNGNSKQSIIIKQEVRPYKKRERKPLVKDDLYSHMFDDAKNQIFNQIKPASDQECITSSMNQNNFKPCMLNDNQFNKFGNNQYQMNQNNEVLNFESQMSIGGINTGMNKIQNNQNGISQEPLIMVQNMSEASKQTGTNSNWKYPIRNGRVKIVPEILGSDDEINCSQS